MTNDVKALIEAVEGGSFAKVSAHQIKQTLGGHYGPWLMSAANGDLNAAKSLHEALLPGWMPPCMVSHYLNGKHGVTVELYERDGSGEAIATRGDMARACPSPLACAVCLGAPLG